MAGDGIRLALSVFKRIMLDVSKEVKIVTITNENMIQNDMISRPILVTGLKIKSRKKQHQIW